MLAQLAQESSDSSGGTAIVVIVAIIASFLIMGLFFYGFFKKAGQPGWAAFIPIVNVYYMLKIVGRPGWWLIGYFIPCVSIIVAIVVMNDLSKSFGHGIGFTLGLIFLPFIFFLILSYSSNQYLGPDPDAVRAAY
jgi:hypothetical protein